MEAWASQYDPTRVRFLCVCVESQRVAQMFDSMFGFRNCTNAYIPGQQYFPRGYGQLGCSGFIVADQKANFIARKTKPFLKYGEEAFRHVEAILSQELDALQLAQQSEREDTVVATVMEGRVTVPSSKRTKLSDSEEEEKKEISLEERLDSFLDAHGTGIDMVDHEHGECIGALKRLLQRPAVDELETAVEILKAHFESEESMMKHYEFGGNAKSDFSAIHSHTMDHEKILNIGLVELRRIQAISCSTSE